MGTKTILFTILACLISSPLLAQSDAENDLKEALRTLQAGKRDLIEQAMMFTEEERAAFWPLYDQYQEATEKLAERTIKLIRTYAMEYKSLSDETARAMLEEYLSIEEGEMKVKKAYVVKFGEILPPKKLMRYIQLENKFEAGVDHELAKNIPLVE